MADTDVKACEECGASVYPEHLASGKAGLWGGKLCCIHCLVEHRNAQVTIGADDVTSSAAVAAPLDADSGSGEFAGAESTGDHDEAQASAQKDVAGEAKEDAPIAIGDLGEINLSSFAKPTITPFTSGGAGLTGETTTHKYKRHLNHTGTGAIRCRIFHAKLNDGALHFMQDQINEWIDQNPEIETKHINTDVGVVEGKSSEPHLLITIFY